MARHAARQAVPPSSPQPGSLVASSAPPRALWYLTIGVGSQLRRSRASTASRSSRPRPRASTRRDAGIYIAVGSVVVIVVQAAGAGVRADRVSTNRLVPVAGMLAARRPAGYLVLMSGDPSFMGFGIVVTLTLGWGWPGLLTLAVVELYPDRAAATTGTIMAAIFAGGFCGPLIFAAIESTGLVLCRLGRHGWPRHGGVGYDLRSILSDVRSPNSVDEGGDARCDCRTTGAGIRVFRCRTGTNMLSRKIQPPGLPRGTTTRARLDTLYREILDRHEGLAVFAAAGRERRSRPSCSCHDGSPYGWLTLNAGDRSGPRLLTYLAAALEGLSRAGSAVSRRSTAGSPSPKSPPRSPSR